MGAVKTLKWVGILLLTWFVMLLLAVFSAFANFQELAVVVAFMMLLVKVVLGVMVVWWLINVAFAVAEWTDEKHGDKTKW